MLPFKDNIKSYRLPVVTWGLIGINVIVFIFELLEGANLEQVFYQFGMVPAYVTAGTYGPRYEIVPFLTSMFMHAGWLHIGGNMLYLYIFGNNVEDRMGHVLFLFFYLASGVGASLLHLATDPSSMVPTVGASGAIAGVMGAYFVLYPKARVRSVVFLLYLSASWTSRRLSFSASGSCCRYSRAWPPSAPPRAAVLPSGRTWGASSWGSPGGSWRASSRRTGRW